MCVAVSAQIILVHVWYTFCRALIIHVYIIFRHWNMKYRRAAHRAWCSPDDTTINRRRHPCSPEVLRYKIVQSARSCYTICECLEKILKKSFSTLIPVLYFPKKYVLFWSFFYIFLFFSCCSMLYAEKPFYSTPSTVYCIP